MKLASLIASMILAANFAFANEEGMATEDHTAGAAMEAKADQGMKEEKKGMKKKGKEKKDKKDKGHGGH